MLHPRSKSMITGVILALVLISSRVLLSTGDITDEFDEFQQLLAMEEEAEAEAETANPGNPTEAEILRKAQKVVLEIRNDNAKQIVERNQFVLVLGFAPWCAKSAELMPRFAEAAMLLRDMESSIVMAKLDAERNGRAASLLGVKGIPSLVFFVNGSSQPYSGGFTVEEIVIWVRKKTGIPVIRLQTRNSAEEFIKKHQPIAVGFFEKFEGTEYEEFLKAAAKENTIQFVEVNDLDILKVLYPGVETSKLTTFLGLIKTEPEDFEQFADVFEEESILRFIELNKFPLVTTLTQLNLATVFSSSINLQLFIFAGADDFKTLLLPLQEVARKYKTKIMFVHADSDDDDLSKPFLTLFSLEVDKPVVAAFANLKGSKYLLEQEFSPKNLDEFCSGLLKGTITPYFKSEPLPQTTGTVLKIVGKTFGPLILDSSNNFFLEVYYLIFRVYSPWCINCEATTKQVEKLAEHFKKNNNLIFGRIDASLNEHPKLQVENFPTLLFYPAGNKSNPIAVSKKRSLREMVEFIDKFVSSGDPITKDEL